MDPAITETDNRLPCRKCGQPSPIGAGGRPKSFCGQECERQWRSEKYAGNKFRAGKRPSNAFAPGFEPWNKGLKGIHLSPETEFKDGHGGTRTHPLGKVTIRDDQNGKPRAWIKVAEPNVWILRAVFNWMAAGNEIPKGCVIHHDNRDTLDDSIGNLQLSTRADHIDEHRGELIEAKARKRDEACL